MTRVKWVNVTKIVPFEQFVRYWLAAIHKLKLHFTNSKSKSIFVAHEKGGYFQHNY